MSDTLHWLEHLAAPALLADTEGNVLAANQAFGTLAASLPGKLLQASTAAAAPAFALEALADMQPCDLVIAQAAALPSIQGTSKR